MTLTQEKILAMLPAIKDELVKALGIGRRSIEKHLSALNKAKKIWYVIGGQIERAGKVAEL